MSHSSEKELTVDAVEMGWPPDLDSEVEAAVNWKAYDIICAFVFFDGIIFGYGSSYIKGILGSQTSMTKFSATFLGVLAAGDVTN
ncbi:uncharacterized protein DNG_05154 [Cephalotrichum gorgonifer]|uniref:Major facilitator superfamily (MFS) profile domain-containing protein n=1 Tax=Cephalotrichum gorgonifer TaxID=2041049 RepID=A0AAE8MXB3_9PEZI|nr:uncharacterized protein DNG_05154 [Cephalotrichum gorgonifer]